MNILSLYGGPRRNGNTSTVLGWVEHEVKYLGHCVRLYPQDSSNRRESDTSYPGVSCLSQTE